MEDKKEFEYYDILDKNLTEVNQSKYKCFSNLSYLDSMVPPIILMISSFIMFIETLFLSIINILNSTSTGKHVYKYVFYFYINIKEACFIAKSIGDNSISQSNKNLLGEKKNEGIKKIIQIIENLIKNFKTETKELVEVKNNELKEIINEKNKILDELPQNKNDTSDEIYNDAFDTE